MVLIYLFLSSQENVLYLGREQLSIVPRVGDLIRKKLTSMSSTLFQVKEVVLPLEGDPTPEVTVIPYSSDGRAPVKKNEKTAAEKVDRDWIDSERPEHLRHR